MKEILHNGGLQLTIRLRITLLYAGVLSACLLIFGICLYHFLQSYLMGDLKDSLKSQTNQISRNVQYFVLYDPRGWDFSIQLDRIDTVRTGIYVQIYNTINGTNMKTGNLRNIDLPIAEDLLHEKYEPHYKIEKVDGIPFLIYSVPLTLKNQQVGILQSAYNISVLDKFFSLLLLALLVLSAVVIAIASLLGWIASKNALRPVNYLIGSVEKIRNSQDLNHRLPVSKQDEIGLLGNTFNAMLERIQTMYGDLDKLYTAQRRFVSDASHELRTPLTTIIGNAQFLNKIWSEYVHKPEKRMETADLAVSMEALNDIADESNRMAKLVNDLLTLARADVGVQINKKDIAIKPVIESVLRKARLMKNAELLRVGDLSELEQVKVLGDADYLQQLFFIFLDNAFKFTEEGCVELTATLTERHVAVIIRDTGIGISESELPHIFERFYREDASRGQTEGTGLGLAIAKWISDEHMAEIEAESSKGEGTVFVLRFPIYAGGAGSD